MFYRNEISDDFDSPKRQHFAWYELEEYLPGGGMWQTPTTLARARFIEESQLLMANPAKFADAMRKAVKHWPNSVANALTTPGLNYRAWLGHAGCYVATGSPEETTRLGWHQLDDGEQWAANAAADTVIAEWRKANAPVAHEQGVMFDA